MVLAAKVTAVEGQVAVRPAVRLNPKLRPTEPAKSKVLVSKTGMEEPKAPEFKLTGPMAEIVKSPTWTTAAAEWDAAPRAPAAVVVTEYVPAIVEFKAHEDDIVTFAVILMAVAGQLTVNPVSGLMTEPRLTVPAKLKVLVRITGSVAPVAPELKFTGVPTMIAKSPTCTTARAEWDAVPGEPEPLIVIRYVPAVVELRLHDKEAVALALKIVRVAGQANVRPAVGLTDEATVTLPAKLNALVKVTSTDTPA